MRRWAKRAWALFSNEAVVPELRAAKERVFLIAVVLRMVLVVCLGVAVLWLGDATDPVPIGFAVIAFGAAPLAWWIWRRNGMLPPVFALRDVLLLSAYATYDPGLRPFCMFLAFSIIAYASITLRRTSALIVTVVGSIGMSIAAIIGSDGNWLAAAVSFPLGAIGIALPVIALSDALAQARSATTQIRNELGVFLWETPSGSVTANYMYGDMMSVRGYPADHFLQPGNWEALLHPEDQHLSHAMDVNILTGEPYRYRYRQRHADGHYLWVEEVGRPMHDAKGALRGFRGLTMEVTDLVERGQRLEELDGLVFTLTTSVGVIQLVDADDPRSLTWTYANPASEALFGVSPLVGRTVADVVPEAFDLTVGRGLGFWMADAALRSATGTIRDALVSTHGGDRTMAIHVNPLPGRQFAMVLEDMTDLYAAQTELERRVYTDDLTGLARRIKIREALALAPVGAMLAVLDLDQFKEINDAFGHDTGDELLKEVATLLAEAPPSTIVARFGGDEFGFYIPPGLVGAEEAGRRISEVLRRPIVLASGLTLQTSGSVGITVKTREDTSPDELLRQADVAMYQSKRTHSSFEIYEAADDTSAPHRMMLLGEIRRAIRNRELELFYQPIVDCVTGDIRRLEALLRWRHPTLGLLPPADFIELTELSNLNTDVVLHVLEIAIADAQRWIDAGYPTPVSINIAGTTLHDARLMDSIMGRIERTNFPRHLLGIELTERQLLLGSGQSLRSLDRLASAGLWLSIDDFGTGTSSLAALRHIPANELKIDKSFVDDLRSGDSALIGTIVAMAHQLGLTVVAEGVEDEVTWRWLRAHGADHAQGYYFARPAPAAAIEAMLSGNAALSWRAAR